MLGIRAGKRAGMSGTVARRTRGARWVFNCGDWKPSEPEWMRLATGIQPEEKERVAKFVFKKDAKSTMAGYLLMRKFIVDVTGLAWSDVVVKREAGGRPCWGDEASSKRLAFNVSHQGRYTVLAGEVGLARVGVDIMKIEYTGGKPVGEFFRIMDRQFSGEEWSVIKSPATAEEQLANFFRFWCLKESYVKATGLGLTIDLRQVSFRLGADRPTKENVTLDTTLFLRGVKQTGWVFQETLIDDDHCAAVALNMTRGEYDSAEQAERFEFIGFDELTRDLGAILPADSDYSRAFCKKPEGPFR